MRACRSLPTIIVLLAAIASPAAAVDLTKIERSIEKEPEYESKVRKYVLLVLGPEAETRIWLVRDGQTLYVDRNANGDLTEPGERLQRASENSDPAAFESVVLKRQGGNEGWELEVVGWGWFEGGSEDLPALELSLCISPPRTSDAKAHGEMSAGS